MKRSITPTAPRADDAATVIGTLPGGTTLIAVSVPEGRQLLTTVDEYVSKQSPFDRQARVNLRRSVAEVTLPIYLDYVASQVMGWSPQEINALKQIAAAMTPLFEPLSLRLPSEVYLVKTSGQEEGYAAYTRRKDTIVLPANMVSSVETATGYGDPLHPTLDISYLQGVVTHECFHLFSKNHPQERFRLYDHIRYRATGADIELPNVPWGPPGSTTTMPELKITNPDSPGLNVCIDMQVPSDPLNAHSLIVTRSLAPVLLANGPYEGGIFFEYLAWWFIAVTQGPDQRWVPVLGKDGRPLMYASAPLMPQYLSLVSANFTQEIFQPDEILAQNFVLMADQPSLDVLVFMRKAMQSRSASA